ncbi:Holliday junction branch migration protein RuvA [Vulgatibacter sp.]|uniref:Holliday junction branch migration protein RuvA n=1 Tax=Vulgatibacter sp. TaxID=1971226 RepID=UPI003568E4FA
MIAQLKGTVDRKSLESVILDVNGVGYLVHCSEATAAHLPVGTRVVLRIHTNVREDALELFGFASELEETLFHELNRVPGVGPRLAMNILSGGLPEEIAGAIVRGDMARLKKLPGVGKKTAERLVVDLRDRLAPYAGAAPVAELPKSAAKAPLQPTDELLQALAALGYKPGEAERLAALARDRAPDGSLEDLVKEALRAR